MADDPDDQGAQDRARINVHQWHELDYWCEKFGVSRDELISAVRKVGVSAKKVEEELTGRTRTTDE